MSIAKVAPYINCEESELDPKFMSRLRQQIRKAVGLGAHDTGQIEIALTADQWKQYVIHRFQDSANSLADVTGRMYERCPRMDSLEAQHTERIGKKAYTVRLYRV